MLKYDFFYLYCMLLFITDSLLSNYVIYITLMMTISNDSSGSVTLECSVPQGSVIGPK